MQLKRAMGLRDLVLFNIVAIVGLRWISTAAAAGLGSILMWVLALVCFFIPQAICVDRLTRQFPEEGGIYVWSKKAFGDRHGFVSGFCYWTNNLLYYPSTLAFTIAVSVYMFGPKYLFLADSKLYIAGFTLVALWIAILVNMIGLSKGKWVQNLGGIGTWVPGVILILLGIAAVTTFGIHYDFANDGGIMDSISLKTIPFFATMCFAFAGLELAPSLSGEIQAPEKNIPRALMISGVFIVLIYILGSVTLALAIPHKDLNLLSGIMQAIERLSNDLGVPLLIPLCALGLTLGGIGGAGAWLAGSARVPFVAGLDHYLPAAFGKVHPKWGTPYVAILVQGVLSTIFILMSFVGSGIEEAYMVLVDTTLIVYFIPYLYMFGSIFVFGKRGEIAFKASDYFFAGLGLLTTALAILLAVLPIEKIENFWLFESKVVGGCAAFVLIALWIFHSAKSRMRQASH